MKLFKTPIRGTLDASGRAEKTADETIAEIAALVMLGGVGTEAEMWERIADAYATVTGSPLDRAAPYNVALCFAILNYPSVGRLIHDELPAP